MYTGTTKLKFSAWVKYAPEILALVLKGMSERDRELCLKYSEEYNMRKLSKIYGISEMRVRQIIYKAMGIAARQLKKVYRVCTAIRIELESET